LGCLAISRVRGKEHRMNFSQVIPYLRAGRLARRRGGGWVMADQFGNYTSVENNMRLTLSDEDRFADDWEVL